MRRAVRRFTVLLVAAMVAGPVAAQEDRQAVSPDNAWSIVQSDCSIDSGWDDGTQMIITLHDDHHDLGVYNMAFRGVVDDKVIPVEFAAGERMLTGRLYEALGHHNAGNTSYVSDVDDALLDAVAQAGSFQFYRGKALLVDLDMTGFAQALDAMRACERAQHEEQDNWNDDNVDDGDAGSNENDDGVTDASGGGGSSTLYMSDVT